MGIRCGKTATWLMGVAGKETAQKIADFVVAGGFSALLAPTHYLRSSDD
jgi:hypothetical protein